MLPSGGSRSPEQVSSNRSLPSIWVQATRPKTLIASVAPVVMGVAMASTSVALAWWPALLTLLTAVCIQIGTNFVNDLADWRRGADQSDRIGPQRVMQAGLLSPGAMIAGICVVFGCALAAGTYLFLHSGVFVLIVGLTGVLLAFLYSVGPSPLAYNGLSDLMVLLYFGVLAVAGTWYVQAGDVGFPALLAGTGPGLLSTAILTVNNIRDLDQDQRAGRRTLIVRYGLGFGRWEYALCCVAAALVPVLLWRLGYATPWLLLATAGLIPSIPLIREVWTRSGAVLNQTLAKTAGLLVLYTILFCVGWLM